MNTLKKIFSSKVRASFFEILFGIDSNELHLREIQRRSDLAIETVRQEAKNLESLELICKRKDGNRTYYKANKVHPLYEEIHRIVIKTSGLKDVLKIDLDSKEIQFAFIFGSIANSTSNSESDIDLYIIGDIGLRKVSNLITNSAITLNREINPHTSTLQEFKGRLSTGDHLISQVFNSPKLMIKGTEDELRRLVKE